MILVKCLKSISFKPGNVVVKFQVHPEDQSKTASIGTDLDPKHESALHDFLCENWDIFTCNPSDMPGIPMKLAKHSLNIILG